MKLGVIQGRLSKPIDGKIQEFPLDGWEKEFLILDDLKLNHIEWIITKKSFDEKFTNLKINNVYVTDSNYDNYFDVTGATNKTTDNINFNTT